MAYTWDKLLRKYRKLDEGWTPFPVDSGSFKGTASLTTNPGIPTEDEWWTATEVGVYAYFDNIEVTTMTDVFTYIKYTQATGIWSIQTVEVPGSNLIQPRIIELKIVSDTMNPLVGNGKIIFCIPAEMNQMSLLSAHAYLSTSAPGDTKIMVRNQSNIMNADMLSTPITIDTYEPTSYTANVPAVVNPSFKQVATGDLIAIDVDQVAAASKGLGVILIFNK